MDEDANETVGHTQLDNGYLSFMQKTGRLHDINLYRPAGVSQPLQQTHESNNESRSKSVQHSHPQAESGQSHMLPTGFVNQMKSTMTNSATISKHSKMSSKDTTQKGQDYGSLTTRPKNT